MPLVNDHSIILEYPAMRRLVSICLPLFTAMCIAQASAAPVLKDGGFEMPPPPAGTFATYNLGQKIGPWTVVGPDGSNVALVSTTQVINGFSFPARKGASSLDLTGGTDPGLAQGVSQTIKTVSGTGYQVTFYVGNINDPGGVWGTTSTVNVYAAGKLLISAKNTAGKAGGQTLVWRKFMTTFTATSSRTVLDFISGDLAGHSDEVCELDSIAVVPLMGH